MKAPPHQLDYAPPPQWHPWKHVRWAVLAFLLVALSITGWKWGPTLWERVQLLYWQHRCLSYSVSPTMIAFSSDPLRIGEIADAPITGTLATDPKRAYRSNPVFADFYRLQSGGASRLPGVIFLHERVSHSGNRRLVVVEIGPALFTNDLTRQMYMSRVFAPAGLWKNASEVSERLPVSFSTMMEIDFGTTAFMGQPDQSDESHFTISCDRDGQRRTIDGWLADDDRILLEEHKPATRP